MTAQVLVDKTADEAFRALQAKARGEHGGNTQPLLVVYAVESFLRRLAMRRACCRQAGDEEISPEEEAAVQEARDELAAGAPTIPLEEIKRKHGLK